MKRFFAGMAAALLAAVLVFPCKVQAISAKKAIVMDANTGRILYEKNANDRGLIASTTKIMTALLVCEQCNVLDRMRVPKEAVGIEGSSIYLQEGEILTIQDLLYGLMLHSGNDAAVALAIYCGGTVEGFVELMNDKAYRLGLQDTHFENPNGLDSPGHFSSAADLAILAAYAMNNPIFAKTVSAKSVTAGNRSFRNHNKLLWRLEGADGVKTGFTRAAGRILVSSTQRQGRRLIAVTMDDPNDWQDHIAMIEDSFKHYSMCSIISKGDILGFWEVAEGDTHHVELLSADNFSYALAENEAVEIKINGTGFVYAPVVAGEFAGYAYICVDKNPVGKIPLIYGATIELKQQEKVPFWKKLLGG